MKEHPVDGPIGLDREVAREYCCVVKAFTTPSFIYRYEGILVLVMKEHPVDGPIGLDREVAREYCRVVNTFTTPSFICWYGEILVLVGYGIGDCYAEALTKRFPVLILVLVGYGIGEQVERIEVVEGQS